MKVNTIVLVCLCLVWIPEVSASEWQVQRQFPQGVLYSRILPPSGRTQFKIEGTVEADIEEVIELFRNIDTYPEWFGYCNKALELEPYSKDHRLFYMVIDAPWPVRDRKVINDVRFDVSESNARITFEEASWIHVDFDQQYIRIPYLQGSCEVDELKEHLCNVTFILTLDPGGDIPRRFADSFTKDHLLKIYDGLKRMLN